MEYVMSDEARSLAAGYEHLFPLFSTQAMADLMNNEIAQNREWLWEELEEADPDRTADDLQEEGWALVVIKEDAEKAVRQVWADLWDMGSLTADKVDEAIERRGAGQGQDPVEDLLWSAVSDLFCNVVWGDYGIKDYVQAPNGEVFDVAGYRKFRQCGTPGLSGLNLVVEEF